MQWRSASIMYSDKAMLTFCRELLATLFHVHSIIFYLPPFRKGYSTEVLRFVLIVLTVRYNC